MMHFTEVSWCCWGETTFPHGEAHALKSSCLNLGAEQLGSLLLQLEKLGNSGSLSGVDALYEQVRNEFDLLQREIAALPEFKKKAA